MSVTVDPILVENALWVGPGETYTRLSDAIAASQDGDTIYVRAGTYLNDFAVVNHAVSIIGVGGFARLEATGRPDPEGDVAFDPQALPLANPQVVDFMEQDD